jgi:hypothetical protein
LKPKAITIVKSMPITGMGALQLRELEDTGSFRLQVKDDGGPVDMTVTKVSEKEILDIARGQLAGQPEIEVLRAEVTDAAVGEARVFIRRKSAVEMMSESIEEAG